MLNIDEKNRKKMTSAMEGVVAYQEKLYGGHSPLDPNIGYKSYNDSAAVVQDYLLILLSNRFGRQLKRNEFKSKSDDYLYNPRVFDTFLKLLSAFGFVLYKDSSDDTWTLYIPYGNNKNNS